MESLFPVAFKTLRSKRIGVISLTFWSHVTSSVMWPFEVHWNQASICNGFRDIQCQLLRNGSHDIDTTSKWRSISFVFVPIDFAYTICYRLSTVSFALGCTV